MIRCVCIGCSAVLETNDEAAGTAVLCSKCGYVIQVPEVSKTVSAHPKMARPQVEERRAHYVLGGMYGLFLLCLPFALSHAKDGSPLCLTMFAVNLLLATGSGFLLLAGMHTPDYLTDWLRMPFTRLRALLLLLPLTVLGLLVAFRIYSP